MDSIESEVKSIIEKTIQMYGFEDAMIRWKLLLAAWRLLDDPLKSRQVNWQNRMIRLGLCSKCGKINKHGGRICEKCSCENSKRIREKRHRLKTLVAKEN